MPAKPSRHCLSLYIIENKNPILLMAMPIVPDSSVGDKSAAFNCATTDSASAHLFRHIETLRNEWDKWEAKVGTAVAKS